MSSNDTHEVSEEELYVPLKFRKQGTTAKPTPVATSTVTPTTDTNTTDATTTAQTSILPRFSAGDVMESKKTLLQINRELERKHGLKTEADKRREEEEYLLSRVAHDRQPLLSRKQAAGVTDIDTSPIYTGWEPPRQYRDKPSSFHDALRKKYGIIVQSDDSIVPPAICKFLSMRIPLPLQQMLLDQGIKTPTAIQMQSIPAILSGRDVIGIASTGAGKTLSFALPMVVLALKEELKEPVGPGEGPLGLVLVPFRELAAQIYEIVENMTLYLQKANFPALHCLLAIGGQKIGDQFRKIPPTSGPHCVVATPGCLAGLIRQRRLNMQRCIYLAMDEADRLVEPTFEEELKTLFDSFTKRHQTVLFSATMPKRVQELVKTALINPVVISSSNAGRANRNIIQEVEYVRVENRLTYLLSVLQKTAPPVLIFANSKDTVDSIHEYLLLKGVDVTSIHGGKMQDERLQAMDMFREGKKDVLVATDVASKGIDFESIQHVINYDMPDEIEDYIHRIGRTGRKNNIGVATSFVNHSIPQTFLLDLKYVLKDAKQSIPPFLERVPEPETVVIPGQEDMNCEFCGGLGHRILECPKLIKQNKSKFNQGNYDFVQNEM